MGRVLEEEGMTPGRACSPRSATRWVNRDRLAVRLATEMSAEDLASDNAFLEKHRDYYHLMTVRRLR